MNEWQKTSCVLCFNNCGLEVITEGSKIVKVRGEKENPRSQGYLCRKGANIAYFQNNPERLRFPLKRVGDRFERISWDQALDEIAAKLREIVQTHGPRSLAYMGGGGQGCHFEAAFGVRFLNGLGSKNHYSPLAQELTGFFWVSGKAFGRQNMHSLPRHQRFGLSCLLGSQSHGEPRYTQCAGGASKQEKGAWFFNGRRRPESVGDS